MMHVNPIKLNSYIESSKKNSQNLSEVKQLIGFLDLTSLNQEDTETSIINLCEQAQTPFGNVAAVCIFSKFVSLAQKCLKNTDIHIATVCNFPSGNQEFDLIYQEINQAIEDGASEIDMVIPYHKYAIGKTRSTKELVADAKKLCGPNVSLKVILEINRLLDAHLIYQASLDVIESGADFIKTSTGKMKPGATAEGAWAMLSALKTSQKSGVGFKAAGGIRDITQALTYKTIAKHLMGTQWVTPKHFRIGASQLLSNILECCKASQFNDVPSN